MRFEIVNESDTQSEPVVQARLRVDMDGDLLFEVKEEGTGWATLTYLSESSGKLFPYTHSRSTIKGFKFVRFDFDGRVETEF